MLYREDQDGFIVIPQRAHEWLTGQLARAWGNPRFGKVDPWEEVCLAAEQHGLSWLVWEQAPTLNPLTGRPHALFELPLATLLEILEPTPRWTLTQARYPALLTSLHLSSFGSRWHDNPAQAPLGPLSADDLRLLGDFLARQRTFQDALLETLRSDPHYAPASTAERLARNQRLLDSWDRISLALCRGLRESWSLAGVPAADGEVSLLLEPRAADPPRITVMPWPFRTETVTLVCEGRRLTDVFAAEADLRAALANAPWATIVTHLSPAE